MNKLDQLRAITEVVADTGDIEAIAKYKPQDATTNPSLLLKAAALPQYASLIKESVSSAHNLTHLSSAEQLSHASSLLAVKIGKEILSLIPGVVSTEVDARLSFDSRATINQARKLIALYEDEGISRDRVLIKIASTWEGIQAASVLEKEGIRCNLTLMFCFEQAVMAADVGAFLISPFVGRILDWYKKAEGVEHYPAEKDPGVLSVKNIYHYYKKHSYDTVVMGASFRNKEEIEALAGCDRLTIGPQFLDELQNDTGKLETALNPTHTGNTLEKVQFEEKDFRYGLNANAMATEKLAEGIRLFVKDQIKLEEVLKNA